MAYVVLTQLRNYLLAFIIVVFYISLIALILPSSYILFYHRNKMLLTVYGTEWPILC